MRISVILSTDIKRSMYWFHPILSNFTYYRRVSFFDSFGLKFSLIVILTNFSHSLKLPARENLQFYSNWGGGVFVLCSDNKNCLVLCSGKNIFCSVN